VIPALQIEAGTPSALVILRGQSKNIRAAAPMDDPFVVAVQDAKGNNCEQGSEYQILISLSSCPSNSSVNLMQSHTLGSVLITSTLILSRSASGCQLTFFSSGLGLSVNTDVLSIIEGLPSILRVLNWSTIVYGGTPFQIHVAVEDGDGNSVRDPVNVSAELQASFSVPLKGTPLVRSNNGSAVFTDLTVDKAAQNYSLTFAVPGLPAETIYFDVLVGAAAEVRLNWTTTDRNVFTSMVPIAPPPVVWSVDAGGNPTNSDLFFKVDLQLNSSWQLPSHRNVSANRNLWGQTVIHAVGGLATFTNIQISLKGSGYFLVFSSIGLKKGTSVPFTLLAGQASWLHVINQPSSGIAAIVLESQPALLVRDDGNNTIDTNARVNTSIAGHPFMHIRGHSSITAASGVVRFSGNKSCII
jgi:hypothetical protein